MIEIVSALIAAIAALAAIHQRYISEHTLRVELLDRKLKIYDSIEKMVSHAKYKAGDLDAEEVWYFKRNKQKMQFLFSSKTNRLFLKLLESFEQNEDYHIHEDDFPSDVSAKEELKKSLTWMDEDFKALEAAMVKEMKVLVNPWRLW